MIKKMTFESLFSVIALLVSLSALILTLRVNWQSGVGISLDVVYFCIASVLGLCFVWVLQCKERIRQRIKKRQFRTLLRCDCKEVPLYFIKRVPARSCWVPNSQVILNFNPELDEAFDYFAKNNLLMMDQEGKFLIIDDE